MKILAGPSIRQTQVDAVYIWLVLDELPNSLEILTSKTQIISDVEALGKVSFENKHCTKMGDHLYVILLPVIPISENYPTNEKIYYDIKINTRSLKDFGLLEGKNSIVYGTDTLPSFYIPLKHHHIAQGSCRKPHAKGSGGRSQYDHFLTLDKILEDSIGTINSRPSMLILTGDQIYADDVALPLLCAIKKQAKRLTGWTEQVPDPKDSHKVITPDDLKLANRDKLLTKSIGFTSGNKDNHLMTFGEFMAMYLVCWGGLDIDMPHYSEVVDKIASKRVKRPKHTIVLRKIFYDEYQEQHQIVSRFLENAKKARRVMANITNYMIFDDHEFTDDWNLTKNNYVALKTNRLSKRMQANALAAYWACQGWGNNPDKYNIKFKKTISTFLTSKKVSKASDFEKLVLNEYWGYTVDGYPAIIVLDTRMHRNYSERFSQLMSAKKIKDVGVEISRLNNNYQHDTAQQSLLLVSPAPYLGFKIVERFQLMSTSLATTVDAEPWIGSKTAYNNLNTELLKMSFDNCSIFSGDVHYAFARELKQNRGNQNNLTITQFVSSSLHNSPNGIVRLIFKGLSKVEKSIFNRDNSPYLYPNNENNDFLSGLSNIGILELNNGIPVKNTFIFYNPNSGNKFHWDYDLMNPLYVNV